MGGFSPQTSIGMRPLLDYVFMEHELLDNGQHRFRMRLWYNTGSGATKLEADGNKYGNMLGHSDGRMDYVWTLSGGRMTLYPNLGKKSISGDESFWGESSIIFEPGSAYDLNRKTLHLADWDGDGRDDIIFVDGNSLNTVTHVWLNRWQDSSWDWEHLDNPSSALRCENGDGPGIHDISVRFADLDGNGYDDYLCIDKDGRTTAFLHGPEGWVDYGQVKVTEGADRANIRWEDVNGDGRADMIWIDKFDGHGTVWYNNGEFPGGVDPGSGSTFHWLPQGTLFDGHTAGTCVYYPDLDGDGRADYHSILGTWTNQAETWFNRCGGGGRGGDVQGDDGPISDPVLPKVASNFHWFDWNRPNFVSLGDSYAAGIGAKAGTDETDVIDDYDSTGKCHKFRGAYAQYLAKDNRVGSRLHHVACTGAVVDQFYNADSEKGQPPQWNRETVALKVWSVGWGTFSFTGNDVGFSKIATWCLYMNGPNPCDRRIRRAEEIMDDPAFAQRLRNTLWKAGRMINDNGAAGCDPNESTESCQTQTWHDMELFVTGYEKFFNAETDTCKIQGVPELDKYTNYNLNGERGKAHRARLNALVERLNGIIKDAVAWVQEQSSYPKDRDNPNVPDIQKRSQSYTYIDADALFEGHRHCEPDDPLGHWSQGWFLEPCGPDKPRAEDGNDGDPNDDDPENEGGICTPGGDLGFDPADLDEPHEQEAFEATCDPGMGGYLGALCQFMHQDPYNTAEIPRALMKGLHPKSAGHLAQANAIWAKIQEYAGPRP
ncbi:hypothetical protein PG991_003816 [Apiospora marii]|uniref:Uncharacterized protein n=2 Tax=Apiospora marii TaxID=335849 RepID=A0ABR1S5S7_9PEZI